MFVDVVLDQPIGRPLTYKATPETLPYLQEGSLVEVLIGAKRHFGIVTKLRRHAPTTIKTVRAIQKLFAADWVDQQTLRLAEKLAVYANEDPGICLFRLLPPPSRKSVVTDEQNQPSLKTVLGGKRFHLYAYRASRFEQYVKMAQKAATTGQQTLLILPNANIQVLADQLSKAKVPFTLASADLSAGKQRVIAHAFKSGTISVLIGTRHIIGWQAKQLRWIIVDDPTHPAHTDEQRPYADTTTIGWLRHQVDGSHLVLGTSLPTLGMALAEQRQSAKRIALPQTTTLAIIAKTPVQQILLPNIEQLISDDATQNQPIAVIAPRTGVGGMLVCQQCQWVLRCPNCQGQVNILETREGTCYDCKKSVKKPVDCPECHSTSLNLIGIGDRSVRTQLERQLGTIPHNLEIGTESLLETERRFKTIVFVYADSPLLSPQLDRPLDYARAIWEACGLSDHVVVQTREPNHPFWLFLTTNPAQAFNQTLERRRKSKLPPFCRHLRIESAKGLIDLTQLTTIRVAKRTSVEGRDSIDLLIPTNIYQQTVKAIAQLFPKARLKADSILKYV
jgi:primosomal protein N'